MDCGNCGEELSDMPSSPHKCRKSNVSKGISNGGVIKQVFKEEKEKFLKEVQRLCNEGNQKSARVIEERLNGIMAIESKLRAKGIHL